jgi:hypothetical protein
MTMRNYVARFALGDTARDGISGYEGVVVAITFWINNCERVTLQARGLHEGKPFEAQTFDAPSVTLVKPIEPPQPQVKTGGPMPNPVRR